MNSSAMCRQTKNSRMQFGVDKAGERYGHSLQSPEGSVLFAVTYELTKSFRRPNPSRKLVLKGKLNHCFTQLVVYFWILFLLNEF